MHHRVDRRMARPSVDGGDVHTSAVFLLSFLLMGVVAAILLTGLGVTMPDVDLSENRLISNIIGVSRTPAKPADSSSETPAPVAVVLAQEEPRAAPVGETQVRKTSVRVTNTGGSGVYVRRTPDMADRLVAWPDNTIMEVVGEDKLVGGQRWRNVKDPAGNVGWIPGEYLSE